MNLLLCTFAVDRCNNAQLQQDDFKEEILARIAKYGEDLTPSWAYRMLFPQLSLRSPNPHMGPELLQFVQAVRSCMSTKLLAGTLNAVTVQLLAPKAADRLGMENSEVGTSLVKQHPFFADFNWPALRAQTLNAPKFAPKAADEKRNSISISQHHTQTPAATPATARPRKMKLAEDFITPPAKLQMFEAPRKRLRRV